MAKNKPLKKFEDDKMYIKTSDVDAVRRRPSMYIASTGDYGVFHLCNEIISNNRDECYKKKSPGNKIRIEISDKELYTRDNGRGIDPKLLQEIFETMQAGSNMEREGGMTAGENGAGTVCVVALSSYLKVTTIRPFEKKKLTLIYEESILKERIEEDYNGDDHGLLLWFRPSKKIFGTDKIPKDLLVPWIEEMEYTLPKDIDVEYVVDGKQKTVVHKPLMDFVDKKLGLANIMCKPLSLEVTGGLKELYLGDEYDREFIVDAIICYSDPSIYHGDDYRHSWMNMLYTSENGAHMDGVINGYIKYITEKVYEKNRKLANEDIKKDILAHLNVFVKAGCTMATMFSAQAKDRVMTKQLEKVIAAEVYKELSSTYNSSIAEFVEIIVGNHRARIEGEKARTLNSMTKEKKKWSVPDTYYPCSSVKTEQPKELFLVEGESAGGGLKLARDTRFQALLCFRGKSLNVLKNGIDAIKALQSVPLENLTKILGCGIGANFDIKKLKFQKIIIATDADIDGYHIRVILLTFFLTFMPQLIELGYVYVVEPPLYEIKSGKEKMYAASQSEYLEMCINSIGNIEISFPMNKNIKNYNVKDFVTEAFDYRSIIQEQSYERCVNRYLLEHVANGFVKYGSANGLINNIDEWLRSVSGVYREIGFDHKTNQLHATIDYIDQLVVIDEKLFDSLTYPMEIIKKFGMSIKYKTDSSPIVATSTLLNFFEFIEDMYPRILQRYKGLGSSAPKITRAIVTDPRTRRAVKITMNNIDTHTRIGILMGDSKEQKLARKGLLMEFPFTKEMLDN